MHNLQTASVNALPIVGLLAFLMGVMIAYQGGVLLQQYGASIFIADLVGLSMLRELAPLITAIIIAGRTGSAYTAQIGAMKVTEEIDALAHHGHLTCGIAGAAQDYRLDDCPAFAYCLCGFAGNSWWHGDCQSGAGCQPFHLPDAAHSGYQSGKLSYRHW